MPRKSRVDAPGTMRHIIIRGIERKAIFEDDSDGLERNQMLRSPQRSIYPGIPSKKVLLAHQLQQNKILRISITLLKQIEGKIFQSVEKWQTGFMFRP